MEIRPINIIISFRNSSAFFFSRENLLEYLRLPTESQKIYQIQSGSEEGRSMDTSNPSVFVNAELLRLHVGKRVRAVIQFLRLDGGSVIGRSTDEQQIIVKGHPPQPYTAFMEVIGIADSNQSIRAEIWSNFGDTFDIQAYNQICQLANGEFKHLFI